MSENKQQAPKQNVIIAGASGAVGLTTVAAFLQAQYSVTAGYRHGQDRLETKFSKGIESRKLQLVQADLRKPDGAEQVVAASLPLWGRIHAIINLTGLFKA